MIDYFLSANSLYPTNEPQPMANTTIPLTSSNNSSIMSESRYPPLLLNAKPIQSIKDIVETIRNIFCTLFITKVNTISSIFIVTQVL